MMARSAAKRTPSVYLYGRRVCFEYTLVGATMRRSTVTTAGSLTRSVMAPPSTSRPTTSGLVVLALMVAGERRLRPAEVLGEDLPDLVRVAVDRLLAQRGRGRASPCSTSALRARATTSPSSWSSVASTRMARSAPVASAPRSVVSVSFGPNVTTMTSPWRAFGVAPFSVRRSAASTAYSSNGFGFHSRPVVSSLPRR